MGWSSEKAIVVGAGIAGLATALRLRHAGYEVEVFESAGHPGGKMNSFENKGYRFDMGPSLFTMPQYVDDLFQLFDTQPHDYYTYSRLDTLCNYFWEDGTTFSASANKENFSKTAADTFNVPISKIEKYLKSSKDKFDLTEELFLKNSLHELKNYLSLNAIKAVAQMNKLHINQKLHKYNKNILKNPKLIQLFDRFATYNGSSPYKTSAIMSLIPHLEMHYGAYFPEGGIKQIPYALKQLAEENGIQFHFKTKVKKIVIENNEVKGIKTKKDFYPADLVVSNVDVFNSYNKLMKKQSAPKKVLQQEKSSSALIFYWGINKMFKELDVHNILFSDRYKEEFDHLFNKKTIIDDPTIYIHISSKVNPEDAPDNCENWFVMINSPANFDQNWDDLIKKTKSSILQKINRILNTNIEAHIECESVLTPELIEKNTGSHRGSLYGNSSNSKFSAFLRHPNFSTTVKNLYFCGGSVHPGGGIPLCLLSAQIVSEYITRQQVNV